MSENAPNPKKDDQPAGQNIPGSSPSTETSNKTGNTSSVEPEAKKEPKDEVLKSLQSDIQTLTSIQKKIEDKVANLSQTDTLKFYKSLMDQLKSQDKSKSIPPALKAYLTEILKSADEKFNQKNTPNNPDTQPQSQSNPDTQPQSQPKPDTPPDISEVLELEIAKKEIIKQLKEIIRTGEKETLGPNFFNSIILQLYGSKAKYKNIPEKIKTKIFSLYAEVAEIGQSKEDLDDKTRNNLLKKVSEIESEFKKPDETSNKYFLMIRDFVAKKSLNNKLFGGTLKKALELNIKMQKIINPNGKSIRNFYKGEDE